MVVLVLMLVLVLVVMETICRDKPSIYGIRTGTVNPQCALELREKRATSVSEMYFSLDMYIVVHQQNDNRSKTTGCITCITRGRISVCCELPELQGLRR